MAWTIKMLDKNKHTKRAHTQTKNLKAPHDGSMMCKNFDCASEGGGVGLQKVWSSLQESVQWPKTSQMSQYGRSSPLVPW